MPYADDPKEDYADPDDPQDADMDPDDDVDDDDDYYTTNDTPRSSSKATPLWIILGVILCLATILLIWLR